MRLFFLLVVVTLTAFGAEYYVAPNAPTGQSGTIGAPWELYEALWTKTLTGGDTLFLRGGTYVGPTKTGAWGADHDNPAWTDVYGNSGAQKSYWSKIQGTSPASQLTIRAYTNELVIIDGGIHCFGPFVVWRDLVFTNSYQVTRADTNSMYRAFGFWAGYNGTLGLIAQGNHLINCVFSNVGHAATGLPQDSGGYASEIYGNIIWGTGVFEYATGWNGAARGAASYSQNSPGGGTLTFGANIVWDNFTQGLGVSGSCCVNNVTFEDNVAFSCADGSPFDIECRNTTPDQSGGILVQRNYTFGSISNGLSTIQIGVQNTKYANDCVVSDNVLVAGATQTGGYKYGGLAIYGFTNITVSGNRMIGNTGPALTLWGEDALSPKPQWFGNAYWSSSSSFDFGMNLDTNGQFVQYSFTGWTNASGFDVNGSSITASSSPTGTWTYVVTNKYEVGRAHIIIYNWDKLASVNVDLSQCNLSDGDTYRVRDVQCLFGYPVLSGTYYASSPNVALPVNMQTIDPIPGWDSSKLRSFQNIHTPTNFQVLVVRKIANDTWPYLGNSTKATFHGATIRGAH